MMMMGQQKTAGQWKLVGFPHLTEVWLVYVYIPNIRGVALLKMNFRGKFMDFGGPLCPDDRLKSLVEKETYFTMMLQSLPSEFSGPYILQAPWLSLACFSSIFCSFYLSLACRIRSTVYTDQRAGNESELGKWCECHVTESPPPNKKSFHSWMPKNCPQDFRRFRCVKIEWTKWT